MRERGYHIGDVAVILGEPPGGNPYRCSAPTVDDERVAALRAFRDGDAAAMSRYTYWFAPWSGGARRLGLEDRGAVDWVDLR